MGRKDTSTKTTNIITGSVIGSNIQTDGQGITIGGVYYPDGIPANADIINGQIVPRTN